MSERFNKVLAIVNLILAILLFLGFLIACFVGSRENLSYHILLAMAWFLIIGNELNIIILKNEINRIKSETPTLESRD